MKTALVILAHGFEEIEATAPIDILRREHIHVTVAGLAYPVVTSARELRIIADTQLRDVSSQLFDMLILPGGEPGTTYLEASSLVAEIIQAHVKANKWIAAICAAPRILNGLGYLEGKKATSFPSVAEAMTRCIYTPERVVVDPPFITAKGAGTCIEFSLALVAALSTQEAADTLKGTLCHI